MDETPPSHAREAAYLAYLAWLKGEGFIEKHLAAWRNSLTPEDYRLAEKLSFGACQRALTLDLIATTFSTKGKLSLKLKEKALLRISLYQLFFLEKIPRWAACDEMVKLAKIYTHNTFASFLNALLRKLPPVLPDIGSYSEKYSYPSFFIDKLLQDYTKEEMLSILERGNEPPQTMARERPGFTVRPIHPSELTPNLYIQNKTQASLIEQLSRLIPQPASILDLCASPGGKTILLADLYPHAEIFANDVNFAKLERLQENLTRCQVKAHLHEGKGEAYPLERTFDLVVVDAPCSNSGVLNKRAEARWRLSEDKLAELQKTQEELLKRALKLTRGPLLYLTCSLLKDENSHLLKRLGLNVVWEKQVLPDTQGGDGGYGALIHN